MKYWPRKPAIDEAFASCDTPAATVTVLPAEALDEVSEGLGEVSEGLGEVSEGLCASAESLWPDWGALPVGGAGGVVRVECAEFCTASVCDA